MISIIQGKLKSFENRSKTTLDSLTIIQPGCGWQIIDFKELKHYRDLFLFLFWRDIKALYAQTVLGFSWAILQPLIQIILFTIIFGNVAKLSTDGIPYILFSSVAIIPWSYMSQALLLSSQSLIHGSNMLGKVYFPRVIFPIIPVLSKLVSFGISILIIVCLMLAYRVPPTWNLLLLPMFFILMMAVPLGAGLWLSSMAIRFRDVGHVMPFVIQLLMYSAPVVYSATSISQPYRIIYSLNPLVGVIEGYRACLLGTAMPWLYIWPGIIAAIILVISGAVYFRRMERFIVDVI